MDINAVFSRKEAQAEVSKCSIEKTIELPRSKYAAFRSNMLAEYDFIVDNTDLMYTDAGGVTHCLLVLGEGSDDGILINSEGSSYGRYTAFLPNARTIIQENPPENVPRKLLSSDALLTMQAKHILFIQGEPGGEKADFTDMDLMDLNLVCAHLSGACFKGAKIDRCDMKDGSFDSCDFSKAILVETDAAGAYFIESNCEGAVFSSCNLHSSFFAHSNLKNTEYDGCAMNYADISNSDVRGASFLGCDLTGLETNSCTTDEHTNGFPAKFELKME